MGASKKRRQATRQGKLQRQGKTQGKQQRQSKGQDNRKRRTCSGWRGGSAKVFCAGVPTQSRAYIEGEFKGSV